MHLNDTAISKFRQSSKLQFSNRNTLQVFQLSHSIFPCFLLHLLFPSPFLLSFTYSLVLYPDQQTMDFQAKVSNHDEVGIVSGLEDRF